MTIIKWEYGTWNNILGYQCGQCGTICPFVEGGIAHENAIDENGGICPRAEKEDVDGKDG